MATIFKRPEILVNAMSRNGDTVLMLPAHNDHASLAAELCKHYAIDIHMRDVFGHTALDIAVEVGSTEVLKMLLKHPNVRPNTMTSWSETSLYRTVRRRQAEAARILLQDGRVNSQAKDEDGSTALEITRRMYHQPLINLLESGWSFAPSEGDIKTTYDPSTAMILYFKG
jgi:ankyrin repeat protein